MKIIVNGSERETSEGRTLEGLLEERKLDPQRVAVERNGAIVSRERFAATLLEEGDTLEIVHFVGGG